MGANADWEESAAVIHNELIARVLGGAAARTKDTPAATDAPQALGVSARASALRLAMEDLAYELHVRRPELVGKSDRESFNEALHSLSVVRHLLALHAALARRESLDTLVTMRDAMAAEHLVHIADREDTRGKVLVSLHLADLRRTRTKLPWYEFWPTGAHLQLLFGRASLWSAEPWVLRSELHWRAGARKPRGAATRAAVGQPLRSDASRHKTLWRRSSAADTDRQYAAGCPVFAADAGERC